MVEIIKTYLQLFDSNLQKVSVMNAMSFIFLTIHWLQNIYLH